MLGQLPALADAATADVHDDLEALGGSLYPSLSQLHSFFRRQHIAFAAASVDEYTLQSVLLKHFSIRRDGFQVNVAILIKRSKWRIDKSDDFLHDEINVGIRNECLCRFS